MQPLIPGYRLTQELHRSARAIVWRGVRESDGCAVVVKTIPQDYPAPQDLARLRREHGILSTLEIPGAVRALGLEPWGNNLALVMEDCGANSLADQLADQTAMPLGAFFPLALACTRALRRLHQHVIHKDVNPRNILWNPATEEIRFIDFGLASEVARERLAPNAPRRLVGSLAFVSPEQTGRMNRDVDFRTDFYSLGVTFYRLLTGQLPFKATDPIEWVHCHITQTPAPLEAVNPAVPAMLGAVVLKLMAKDPEDRYQSAQGLLRDLGECERRWRDTGEIAPFELAQSDVMAQFRVPQRLHDRHAETRAILEAFGSAADAVPTLVTVSGPAGIGKSALVNDVRKAIVGRNGWFFEGKFDQFRRHLPYAAVSQALGGLVRQLMAEPEERLARWRDRLTAALGPNGRIAVDLVPELAGVIGEPPPVVALHPTEEQNRFLVTIQSLIGAFARPEHPLVLFLDDLQWSDAATLTLVHRLLEGGEGPALLLIGAYRDDEVGPEHPLTFALQDVERTQRVTRLPLGPLAEDTINVIVAGALQSDLEATRSLSTIIQRKSAGNPFFVSELLRTLHQDGLFAFDHGRGRWTWDLEGIRRAKISDNVVDFMVARIQRLAPETQTLLRHAACMGDSFDLVVLAALTDRSMAATTAALRPAIAAGLVAPLHAEDLLLSGQDDDGPTREVRCQFLHDRVRQAAYALNSEAERRGVHLSIGRLLLGRTPEPEREARATDIAQHLNEGRAMLADEAECLAAIRVNLAAARKAKAAAAYRSAFDFTGVAHELLMNGAWENRYELAFEVYSLHGACAYLSGELAIAQACHTELLARARTAIEKAEIHALRAAQHTFSNRLDEAIDEGLRGLALLGIQFSARPSMAVMLRELFAVKAVQAGRKATDFDGAPLLSDRKIRLAMTILEGFLVPAYLSGNQTLFGVTVLRQAALSMRHGNCAESVSAYSGYAVLLAGLGDLKGALAFGQLALRLTEKMGVVDSRCRTLVLYGLFSHSWSQPWGELDGWFKASVEAGLQSGDFMFMAFACGYVHLWDPRIDLKTAVEEGRRYLAVCRRTPHTNALDAAQIAQSFWLNLRGETEGPLSLSHAGFDEAACLRRMTEANYVAGHAIFHLYKLQAACFARDWDAAWQQLLAADKRMKVVAGSPYTLEYCVYGFTAAVHAAERPGPHVGAAKRHMRAFHRQMRGWARHCPGNFAHHLAAMDAELARLQGRTLEAQQAYDRAIALARVAGFVRHEARANEAAGHFYRALGQEKVAATYLRDAREGYMQWGAVTKVQALDAALSAPGAGAGRAASAGLESDQLQRFNLGLVPQLVESGVLDLATVWKATQAISGEATFERLLKQLMAIVKESAGAQRAVLVLKEGEDGPPRFLVQAESPETGEPTFLQGEALDRHPGLPVSLIRYVARSQTSVVLNRAATEGDYVQDPYMRARRPRSVVAMPVVNQGHLIGVLYLENHLLSDAFTPERLSVLQILAGQAAVSLQNVRAAERATYLEAERVIKDLYARELEARVDERTAELTHANERLRELDRLKTHFLNAVSHELRTPLTSIVGYAEFLKDELGGPVTPLQQEFVQHIRHSAKRLQGLVDDMLDFAQLEAGTFRLDPRWGYLAESVAGAFESMRPQAAEKGLTLESELPAMDLEGTFDAVRLEQVVLNLVGNAIKFTPQGGTVRLRMTLEGDTVKVAVTDTGIGVPAELHPLLFDKFYQVDPSSTRKAGGTGLGLAISRGLVEAMGGAIGVESTPGEGSTFWFTFPRHGQPYKPEFKPASDASGRLIV
jgi:predicted ATPase/signal transduction histidine kinase